MNKELIEKLKNNLSKFVSNTKEEQEWCNAGASHGDTQHQDGQGGGEGADRGA